VKGLGRLLLERKKKREQKNHKERREKKGKETRKKQPEKGLGEKSKNQAKIKLETKHGKLAVRADVRVMSCTGNKVSDKGTQKKSKRSQESGRKRRVIHQKNSCTNSKNERGTCRKKREELDQMHKKHRRYGNCGIKG